MAKDGGARNPDCPMERHLFTVEDRFAIRQHGVGIVPEEGEVFRVGRTGRC